MTYSTVSLVVSVRLMTYNHEGYIAEAIESCLMQQTDFRYEIVIGDDFSTDGTKKICEKYAMKYPEKIKLLDRSVGDKYWDKRQKNGRLYNFTNIIENCRGKYIALLDGDDYWTDPLKLQKQVDILENNADIIVCHHWHKYAFLKEHGYEETDAPIKGQGYLEQQIATVKEIFENKLRIKSRTMMFRNVINESFFPDWFYKVAFGDVPLNFLLGKYGDFYFIDEPMAVYRQTGKGASSHDRNSYLRFFIHYTNWICIWGNAINEYKSIYWYEAMGTINSFYFQIINHYQYNNRIIFKLFSHALLNSHLGIVGRCRVIKPFVLDVLSQKLLILKKKVKRKY